MASKIEIANRGLSKLGCEPILAFTDDSKAGRLLNAHYDIIRDALIREYLWNFAAKRTQLPALDETPSFGFTYTYQLPADCLRVMQIGDVIPQYLDNYVLTDLSQYQIEGRKIITNFSAPLKIRYIARITDPTLYDATFVEALACKIAMEFAESLTQSNTKRQLAQGELKQAILSAVRTNAIERPTAPKVETAWTVGRI